MIDKLIVDDAKITLTEKDKLPYTYMFSTAKTHKVRYALSDTDEISPSAFANCSNMVSIKFPEEISYIKRRAFENCSRLDNVVITENIKYIGANAWDGCTSLKTMTFESDTPEDITNYSEIPSQCKVYIPDDSKYTYESKYVADLTPNTRNYYTKTAWNYYTYVPARNFTDGVEYYYDRWTNIAPNEQTIEQKNRIVVNKVMFEQQNLSLTVGQQITLNYTLDPVNPTNTKLHAQYSSNNGVAEVLDISDTDILIRANKQGSVTIFLYAESGVYDRCEIQVR